MRIFFTGGTGKAGAHAVRHFRDAGHRVTNADVNALGEDGIDDLEVDITDLGDLHSALGTYPTLGDIGPSGPEPYDAVVHYAAIPRIGLLSDAETFRINILSTYNVLEAATARGIRKIVIASSETTYGVCFSADPERSPLYLPVDEDHPVEPEDSYALSKVSGEVLAKGFAMRTGAAITAVRIGNVIEPDEYGMFQSFVDDPSLRRRNLFQYVDARDLAQLVLLALEKRSEGFRVYNAASGNAPDLPAPEIARRFYPSAEIRGDLADDTVLYSIARAREELGYEPQVDWKTEMEKARG